VPARRSRILSAMFGSGAMERAGDVPSALMANAPELHSQAEQDFTNHVQLIGARS
jgi:hypothetical protein